ncbi:MAG: DUF2164 domain-containing protein [Gemmatimonadota bacterium]|nr:DUF2164 domain-containing protein [Gemmatimonadota bacterium]MDH5197383.1 DUF2164 domain-containing protein [Gemmatimonadota bacterium]
MRGKPTLTIPDEARTRAIASIRQYFAEELDQDIGDLKAGLLLGYVLEELGPTICNAAIADARAFFEERAADLEGVCYHAEFPCWNRPRE